MTTKRARVWVVEAKARGGAWCPCDFSASADRDMAEDIAEGFREDEILREDEHRVVRYERVEPKRRKR